MRVAASPFSIRVDTAISRSAMNVKDVVTGIYTIVCAGEEVPWNEQNLPTA